MKPQPQPLDTTLLVPLGLLLSLHSVSPSVCPMVPPGLDALCKQHLRPLKEEREEGWEGVRTEKWGDKNKTSGQGGPRWWGDRAQSLRGGMHWDLLTKVMSSRPASP